MSLEVNITKKLNGFTLHANFAARSTATAILGASGCGKSMTLRCIAGIVKPDAGRIVLDGRVLFDSAQHIDLPPQQRGVGLLFQNYALFPNMTVEQNILCALKKEKDPAARRAACAEALRAMRLEELAKRLPGALSGGQQQRAALARILAAKPRILMLGEVLRAGTTKEVFADPRTRAAARLTGCKNILPCTRVGEHTVHLAGWEQPLTVALPVPEGCRAVGIRAHDFAPCAPGTPNSLPVQAVTTSENPFDWNMIFTLPGGETRLWWKVSKETLAAPPPKAPACLAAAPENIMPLV